MDVDQHMHLKQVACGHSLGKQLPSKCIAWAVNQALCLMAAILVLTIDWTTGPLHEHSAC